MKELSIEEKARAYDEAIERAKSVLLDCTSEEQNVVEYICPELKEGEDDRIRIELVKYLQESPLHYKAPMYKGATYTPEEAVAWLEKQGKKQKIHDVCDTCVKQPTCKSDCFLPQEQKPTDKVEPKFKVGDWIIKDNYSAQQVILMDKDSYTLDGCIDGKEILPKKYIESNYHLWTIQDAKDGDVLMANAPFIFNGNLDGGIGCPGAYCAINTLGNFQIPNKPTHWTGHTTTPATEEQRDLLFQKMKEAGYEWDADKKELKKIEQKPAEWSDTDQIRLDCAICSILAESNRSNGYIDKDTAIDLENWLNSLKDRVLPQPKQKWSEEDKMMLQYAIEHFERQKRNCIDGGGRKKSMQEFIDWLKSLRPQPKWKPDSAMLVSLEYAINHISKKGDKNILTKLLEQLKKLKD